MDCCPPPEGEAGYALPAALMMTLGMAVIASALLSRGVGELRAARADYERLRAEAVLSGVQTRAANAVVSSRRDGPYAWPIASELGSARVVARPEAGKLSLAAAAALSDQALQGFGVTDIAGLRARLENASRQTPLIATFDSAPLWRLCAPEAISAYGEAQTFIPPKYDEPGAGTQPQSWRVGEVWSVAVATPDGWRDNRVVRFTGDALNPAATISRRFLKVDQGELSECDAVLNGLAQS